MKQIKRIQCGRIDGKYYRTTVYTDGRIDSYGVVYGWKRLEEITKLMKLTGAKVRLASKNEYEKIKNEIDRKDAERMRKYIAIRRDLKCVW
jgi:hypothetical protein